MKNLLDINWLHLGQTDEHGELKAFVAHVCRDVTKAACIDEICINDVLQAFKQHGYVVVKETTATELSELVADLAEYWREDCSGHPDTGSERLHLETLIDRLEALC